MVGPPRHLLSIHVHFSCVEKCDQSVKRAESAAKRLRTAAARQRRINSRNTCYTESLKQSQCLRVWCCVGARCGCDRGMNRAFVSCGHRGSLPPETGFGGVCACPVLIHRPPFTHKTESLCCTKQQALCLAYLVGGRRFPQRTPVAGVASVMPSPPVVRLSQALYNDVPAQSCRKGGSKSSANEAGSSADKLASPSPVVRLLLPRTFAVADRTYGESLVTTVGGTSRERYSRAASSCSRDVAGRDLAEQEHDRGRSGSKPCTTASSCSTPAGNPASTSRRQPPSSIRSPTQGRVALVVVVESVLSFTAVCGLLDRAHAAAAVAASPAANTAGEAMDCEEPSSGDESSCCHAADGCRPQDAARAVTDDGDARGVSKAVGRLVDWLRIAAASATAAATSTPPVPGHSGSEDAGNARASPMLMKAVGKSRRTADHAALTTSIDLDVDNDSEVLAAAAAGVAAEYGHASGTPYEARQCEGGPDWRVFDIKPTEAGAPGKDTNSRVPRTAVETLMVSSSPVTRPFLGYGPEPVLHVPVYLALSCS